MIVIPLIIYAVVTWVFYYFVMTQSLEERIDAQLESVVVLKENRLNDFLDGAVADVGGLANEKILLNMITEIQEAHSNQEADAAYHEGVRQILEERLAYKKDFEEFFILGMEGRVHISTNEMQEGQSRLNEPYFIEGQKGAYIQSFYYDTALQQPAITISTAIKDNKGEVIGVLAGRINLSKVSDIMTARSGMGESGETYLVNKFNLLVSRSRFIEGIEFKKPIHTTGVKDCLKGQNGHILHLNYRNVPVICVYRWIPEREVCLLAEIEEREATAPVRRLFYILFLVGSSLFVLAIILGYFLEKRVSKPIIKLRDAAAEISKGNLDKKIDIKTKDEIEELATAFNQMTVDIKKSRQKLKEYSKELEKKVEARTKELNQKNEALERFNKMTVGRELRMIELKKRIKKLEEKPQKE